MCALVRGLAAALCGAAVALAASTDDECAAGARAQPARPGGAMLQVANDHAAPGRAAPLSAHGSLLEAAGAQRRSRGIGGTAELTEEGYSAVAATCCVSEMEEFARRLVADLGLEICQEGGLSGTIGFHTCEKGAQGYAKLAEDIKNGQHGDCAWTAAPGYCGGFDFANCGSVPDGFHRRRVCTGNPNTDAYAAATDSPATDAPATDAPATDAPATAAPTTAAPATTAPATAPPATTAAPVTVTSELEGKPVALVCAEAAPGANSCAGVGSEAGIEECKFCAAPSRLGGGYQMEVDMSQAAKGCYRWTGNGGVFFNKHPSGASRTEDITYCVQNR